MTKTRGTVRLPKPGLRRPLPLTATTRSRRPLPPTATTLNRPLPPTATDRSGRPDAPVCRPTRPAREAAPKRLTCPTHRTPALRGAFGSASFPAAGRRPAGAGL